jgi:hypothetical protein
MKKIIKMMVIIKIKNNTKIQIQKVHKDCLYKRVNNNNLIKNRKMMNKLYKI